MTAILDMKSKKEVSWTLGDLINIGLLHHKGKYVEVLKCSFHGEIKKKEINNIFTVPLTFKAPNENCSRQHFNFLLLSFEENKA